MQSKLESSSLVHACKADLRPFFIFLAAGKLATKNSYNPQQPKTLQFLDSPLITLGFWAV